MKPGTKLVSAALAAIAVTVTAPWAQAQFPEKNIEFVIPFGPGGGFDRTVRLFAPVLERTLPNKVQVLPRNIAGAGGRKGLASVYRARPDGHMLAIANMPGAALPAVMGEQVEYDLSKFVWIARLATEEYMLAVPAKTAFRTVDDLKKLGRPVKIPHTDFGSTAFAAAAILAAALDIQVSHLTGYRGTADYIVATVRGDGDATVAPVSTLGKFLRAGDMRGIFTTEEKSTVAGVPTIASLGHADLSGLGVERYVLAPPGTPAGIAKILSEAFARAAQDPQLVQAAEKTREPIAFLAAGEAKASAERTVALYSKYKSVLGKR